MMYGPSPTPRGRYRRTGLMWNMLLYLLGASIPRRAPRTSTPHGTHGAKGACILPRSARHRVQPYGVPWRETRAEAPCGEGQGPSVSEAAADREQQHVEFSFTHVTGNSPVADRECRSDRQPHGPSGVRSDQKLWMRRRIRISMACVAQVVRRRASRTWPRMTTTQMRTRTRTSKTKQRRPAGGIGR